jgi:GMP synthase-like glutamine amidotransferase
VVTNHSEYSAYEEKEWIHKLRAYVKRVYEEHPLKKIIGICFGHQIVAQALGGKVELNQKGWEIAVRQMQLSDNAREIFNFKNATMVLNAYILQLMIATTTNASGHCNSTTFRCCHYWIE